MADFASRIRELRTKKGFTQKQIAAELGLALRTWQDYEGCKRTPTYEGLIKLADYFGVSPNYLTGRRTPKEELSQDDIEDYIRDHYSSDENEDLVYNVEIDPTGISEAKVAIEEERLNNPDVCDGKFCEQEQPCSADDIWQCQFETLLEKKWGITEPLRLYCSGTACHPENKNRRCQPWEIWVCRDVISKLIPPGHFWGRFKINLPQSIDKKEERWLDFAIETPDGKRIVVELDEFDSYVRQSPAGIDNNIFRQNLLASTGWIVLRFTFDQLKNNIEQCQDILRLAIEYDGSEFNKTPVLKARCPNPKCNGEVRRLRTETNGFIWECQQCKKFYDQNTISPDSPTYNHKST